MAAARHGRPTLRRWIASVLLLLHTAACMTWRPQSLDEPALAEAEVPSRVRVTRVDGSTVILEEVTLRADTLSGWDDEAGVPRSVALSDIESLEGWRADPGWLFVPPLVAVILVVNELTRLRPEDLDPATLRAPLHLR